MMYFYCPSMKSPCGGVRIIHEVAAILGAQIIQEQTNAHLDWFADRGAMVVSSIPYEHSKDDVLVVPETHVHRLEYMDWRGKFGIFNQNPYYTFDKYPYHAATTPDAYYEQAAFVVTVSDAASRILQDLFPRANVNTIDLYVDGHLYYPGRKNADTPTIAYMTRKHCGEVNFLMGYIRRNHLFEQWKFTLIDHMHQDFAASVLRSAHGFLSFGSPEGYGLSLAEALVCGCWAVGYDGYALKPLGQAFLSVGPMYNPGYDPGLWVQAIQRQISKFGTKPVDNSWFADQLPIRDRFVRSVKKAFAY